MLAGELTAHLPGDFAPFLKEGQILLKYVNPWTGTVLNPPLMSWKFLVHHRGHFSIFSNLIGGRHEEFPQSAVF